jgi:hypothetical protein
MLVDPLLMPERGKERNRSERSDFSCCGAQGLQDPGIRLPNHWKNWKNINVSSGTVTGIAGKFSVTQNFGGPVSYKNESYK